jgi:hypothetical protein
MAAKLVYVPSRGRPFAWYLHEHRYCTVDQRLVVVLVNYSLVSPTVVVVVVAHAVVAVVVVLIKSR